MLNTFLVKNIRFLFLGRLNETDPFILKNYTPKII